MASPQSNFFLVAPTPKAAAYGTAVLDASLTDWWEANAPALFQTNKERVTNEARIKGHPYGVHSARKAGNATAQASLEHPLYVDLMALWTGLLFSNIATSGGPTDYVHTVKWGTYAITDPWSTSVICAKDRDATGSYKKYNGVQVNSIQYTVSQESNIGVSVELLGDGSETDASGVTPPAIETAKFANCLTRPNVATVKLGPSLEDISGIIESVQVTMSAELDQRRRPGGGELVTRSKYGENAPRLELQLVIEASKAHALFGNFTADDELQFELDIQESAARYMKIQANSVSIGEFQDTEFDGTVPQVTIPLILNYANADDSPHIITFGSGTAVFLA